MSLVKGVWQSLVKGVHSCHWSLVKGGEASSVKGVSIISEGWISVIG